MGGDDAFVAELIEQFLADSPALVAAARHGLEAGDAEEVRRAAHTLKSNAATFGRIELADRCRGLEARGEGGRVRASGRARSMRSPPSSRASTPRSERADEQRSPHVAAAPSEDPSREAEQGRALVPREPDRRPARRRRRVPPTANDPGGRAATAPPASLRARAPSPGPERRRGTSSRRYARVERPDAQEPPHEQQARDRADRQRHGLRDRGAADPERRPGERARARRRRRSRTTPRTRPGPIRCGPP